MSGLTVEFIPDPEQGGFTAHVPDIPAYGEGESKPEALDDLKEALRAYIDAFGLDDALARVAAPGERCAVECRLSTGSTLRTP